MVAAMVQSRNSDRLSNFFLLCGADLKLAYSECAKRWTDTLNPAIDRTTWTPEGVSQLKTDILTSVTILHTSRTHSS